MSTDTVSWIAIGCTLSATLGGLVVWLGSRLWERATVETEREDRLRKVEVVVEKLEAKVAMMPGENDSRFDRLRSEIRSDLKSFREDIIEAMKDVEKRLRSVETGLASRPCYVGRDECKAAE